jgi:hypothetical protein
MAYDHQEDPDNFSIECDLCTLRLSFADYASHVESHMEQLHMLSLVESDSGEDYELNLMMQELMGHVEIGVDDIDRVTSVVVLDKDTPIQCPICLEVQDKVVKRTLCKHDFCTGCITKWLSSHKTCPICIADVQMLS